MPEATTSHKDQKSAGHLSHNHEEHEDQANTAQFSEDEIQNLREIFDLFDKEKNGTIDAKDLHTIMSSL
jgi:Ca2+-binding EF-hand superfamily protein